MTTPPLATWECVVLDCPNPLELAEFYCALLGGQVNQPDRRWAISDRWATLHLAGGNVITFQAVDDYVAPNWPDPGFPQQVHLDFHVSSLAAAENVVTANGGTRLHDNRGWVVFADPAGHPFCLIGN